MNTIDQLNTIKEIADNLGGEIKEVGALPGGSGFAVMSLPLPEGHWLTANPDGFNIPPMRFRLGVHHSLWIGEPDRFTPYSRERLADIITEAGRYAVRCATRNGQDPDFDPDALVRSIVVGLFGYFTPSGRSSEEWQNPPEEKHED